MSISMVGFNSQKFYWFSLNFFSSSVSLQNQQLKLYAAELTLWTFVQTLNKRLQMEQKRIYALFNSLYYYACDACCCFFSVSSFAILFVHRLFQIYLLLLLMTMHLIQLNRKTKACVSVYVCVFVPATAVRDVLKPLLNCKYTSFLFVSFLFWLSLSPLKVNKSDREK